MLTNAGVAMTNPAISGFEFNNSGFGFQVLGSGFQDFQGFRFSNLGFWGCRRSGLSCRVVGYLGRIGYTCKDARDEEPFDLARVESESGERKMVRVTRVRG